MSVKVVVINGAPGSGKTTFEYMCQHLCNLFEDENKNLKVDIYSTIDFVKYLATLSGWDGTKTPKNRKFLSDLKDLLTEWNNVPFKKVEEVVKVKACDKATDWILFVDCREPAEIQKLKERLNAATVLMRRESVENIEVSNHADSEVFNYNYDLTIFNNSDIIHLEDEARKFIEYMKKEEVPYYINVD